MIGYRSYRNSDSPALAALWNRGLPAAHVVRPLDAHQFDALAVGRLGFERAGLIVACDDASRIVGFAHAGFGPLDVCGPSHGLDTSLGTIAMLVVEPGPEQHEIARNLLDHARDYLRLRGAQVIYAGGQYPVNPFYWGIYGGSEFAGLLRDHVPCHEVLVACGFGVASRTILLERDLATAEPKHPKLLMVRRKVELAVEEDALPRNWWDGLALHGFHPNRYDLVDRESQQVAGHAWTYEMGAELPLADGLVRRGLIDLHVEPAHRRKGFGRYILNECLKHARSQMIDRFCVQTSSSNEVALALYRTMGFEECGESWLYRLAGS